jgi:Flp pilus assembly protein TadD
VTDDLRGFSFITIASLSKRSRQVASAAVRHQVRHQEASARANLPEPWGARAHWQLLAGIFVLALVVRLVVAAELWDLPLVRTPKLDSAEYLSWARRLASGDLAWPVVTQHGPGYPFFLAAALIVGSGSLKVAMAVQAVAGSLAAVMLAVVAGRLLGTRTAAFAGAAYALYGPAVYIDTALLSEGLLLFLLAGALLLLSAEPTTALRSVAAGLVLGLATLVRPTAFVIALGCAVWLWFVPGRNRAAAASLLASWCLVALLAVAQNWSVSGSPTFQGYGGLNFYIGNSPMSSGRPTFRLGAGWDGLNAEASRAGIADPVKQDWYYVEKTFAEIGRHPARFIELLMAKLLWVLQAEEVRDSHSFYFFADRSSLLRILPRWAVLFPLACIGTLVIARAARERPLSGRLRTRALLLVAYSLAAGSTAVLLVIGTRYRMPLIPALAIAAGVGLGGLSGVIGNRGNGGSRRYRALIPYVAVGAAAITISHLLHDPRNRNLAEEWALTGSSLITEHDLPGAEAAYRHALALDAGSGLAWDGLGLAEYDDGRLPEARTAFSRAVQLDPESARSTFHLALTDERQGRLADAIIGYRRAAALSPYDAEVTRHLATALGLSGRSAEARDEMRRVVQLDPSNGEAWVDLCLLSLDAHDVESAALALQRAEQLGPAPERLAFAREALARARR